MWFVQVLALTDAPLRKVVGTSAFRDPGAMVENVLQVLGFPIDIDELARTAVLCTKGSGGTLTVEMNYAFGSVRPGKSIRDGAPIK